MRKIYSIISILILSFIFLTSITYPSAVTGSNVTFDLKYKVEFKNRWSQPMGIEIKFPVPKNEKLHQVVAKMDFYPKPVAVKVENGTKYVTFRWKKIPPDKTVKCGYNAKICSRRVLYNVDANKVKTDVPAKLKKYLKSTKSIPAKDPIVRKLADKIISGEPGNYYRALNLFDFVRKLRFKLKKEPSKVQDVIKTRTCQCSDATELYVSLCRSIGIPARYVGGFYLKITDKSTPDTHAWAEVYFPPYGWVPVDPTMARFDDYTRFTRFSEIDAPYIVLWRNQTNPFRVQVINSRQKVRTSDFKVSITYKAHGKKSSLSLKKSYPALSLNLKPRGVPRLLSSNNDARNAYLTANKQLKKGDLAGAERNARNAIKIDPSFAVAYRKLIQVYEKKNRLKLLRKDLSSQKNNKSSKGAVYYAIGVIDTLIGNYSLAEREFNLAQKKGMPSFLIAHNKGILYMTGKQVPKSAKYFNKALLGNPHGLSTYRSFFELLDFLNDYSTIVTTCKKALKIKIRPASFFQVQLNRAYKDMKNGK